MSYEEQVTKQANLLIVDDEESICRLLSFILENEGYLCFSAKDTTAARNILDEKDIALILCDIHMPGESGVDFIRFVMDNFKDVCAIMVTGVDDKDLAHRLFEIGVYDYITKPITSSRVLISVSNALHRRSLEISNRSYLDGLEKMVEARTESIRNAMKKIRRTTDGVVRTIALTVETRDPYTAGHQRSVAELARAIAVEMRLPDKIVEGTYLAGLIHDLGKISIPAEILSKPGQLTTNQFNLIKEHPQIGYEILREVEFPYPIAEMVLQHHERLDGSGYPAGLEDSEIMLEARIIAVADVVEAIASHRPYRVALGMDSALGEISEQMDILYDAKVVEACLELFTKKGFHF
jgi:putative two-component system response regulator